MEFYKDKKSIEFKVGLFSIIGIFILVASYCWFTGLLEAHKYNEIQVIFDEAKGVEIGSPVTILGIKRGRVKDIKINEEGVLLTLQTILDIPLTQDSEFYIDDSDLMGDAEIEINPGVSSKIMDFSLIQRGNGQFGMSTLFADVSIMIEDLKIILREISKEDGLIFSTKSMIDSSRILLDIINNTYADNEDKIVSIIDNLDSISLNINSLINDNKENINQTTEEIVSLLQDTRIAIDSLKSTNSKIGNLADEITHGDGSAQQLLRDKELYDNLKNSSAALDSLLHDIKDDPKKYFKFSVF